MNLIMIPSLDIPQQIRTPIDTTLFSRASNKTLSILSQFNLWILIKCMAMCASGANINTLVCEAEGYGFNDHRCTHSERNQPNRLSLVNEEGTRIWVSLPERPSDATPRKIFENTSLNMNWIYEVIKHIAYPKVIDVYLE